VGLRRKFAFLQNVKIDFCSLENQSRRDLCFWLVCGGGSNVK
jgi:phage/plasmid-associated DNA primase